MIKRKVMLFVVMILSVSLFAACSSENKADLGPGVVGETVETPSPEPIVEAISFPEASEECTKAKAFYGYYILQDSDVIFAMNENESRFCVKFNAFAGQKPMVLEGSVVDGICFVDPHFNGLFGEDVQMMYEDAMAEEAPWAPITRG